MTLMFHSTTYKPGRAVAEINQLLLSFGARRVSMEYGSGTTANRKVIAISFTLLTAAGEREFLLPARTERVRAVLAAQGLLIRSRADEHAESVAWRTLLEWLKLQLALIQTDQVKPDEVMIGYMLIPSDNGNPPRSLYEQFSEQAALPAGKH